MIRTPQSIQLRDQAYERHLAERRALRVLVLEGIVTFALLAMAIGLWGFSP